VPVGFNENLYTSNDAIESSPRPWSRKNLPVQHKLLAASGIKKSTSSSKIPVPSNDKTKKVNE